MSVLMNPSTVEWAASGLYSAGIHPLFEGDWDAALVHLEALLEQGRLAAVGECGLDRRSPVPMDRQAAFFERQMLLADRYARPLIIHCVQAWDLLLQLHRRHPSGVQRIVHGFRGKPQLAAQLLRAGLHLSFGWHYNVASLRLCPADRYHIETDEAEVTLRQVWEKQQRDLLPDDGKKCSQDTFPI